MELKINIKLVSVFIATVTACCICGGIPHAYGGEGKCKGEALISIYMPHQQKDYAAYCSETLPRAEKTVCEIAESCGGRIGCVYPYLSFCGDLLFAYVQSDTLSSEELIEKLKCDKRVEGVSANHSVHIEDRQSPPTSL